QALAVPVHVVVRAVRGMPAQARPTAPPPRPAVRPPPTQELSIIALLDEHPDLWETAEKMGIGSLLTDVRLRDMYSGRRNRKSFLDEPPADIRNLVAEHLHGGAYARVDDPHHTLVEVWRTLQHTKLQTEIERLERELKDALVRGDAGLARELSLQKVQTRNMAETLRRRPEDEPR